MRPWGAKMRGVVDAIPFVHAPCTGAFGNFDLVRERQIYLSFGDIHDIQGKYLVNSHQSIVNKDFCTVKIDTNIYNIYIIYISEQNTDSIFLIDY